MKLSSWGVVVGKPCFQRLSLFSIKLKGAQRQSPSRETLDSSRPTKNVVLAHAILCDAETKAADEGGCFVLDLRMVQANVLMGEWFEQHFEV